MPRREYTFHPVGYQLARGAVLAAFLVAPVPSLVAQASPASQTRVSGTVFDSLSRRPLAGATVRLVRAADPAVGRTAISDSSGAFALDTLAPGVWLATFLHPRLDSLGIEPPLLRLEVETSAELALPLATPSARTLRVALCGAQGVDSSAVITGVVRSAESDQPLDSAIVTIEWPEWVVRTRGLETEQRRRQAVANSSGRYLMCGVPVDLVAAASAANGRDTSGVVAIEIPSDGFVHHDFVVASATALRLTDQPDSASGGTVRVTLGPATVRGVARDVSGRAVEGALVRIIGSGVAARTGRDGQFVVTGAAAGTQTLEARAVGRAPVRRTVVLRPFDEGASLELVLPARPSTSLDTVRVVGAAAGTKEVQAFERRARSGRGGIYMNGSTVRQRTNALLTDAFRAINGVRVVDVAGYGQRIVMRGTAGRECQPILYIDGVRLHSLEVKRRTEMFLDDFVVKDEVAAVEVYPRSAGAPAEFTDMEGCGSVLVWTRGRFGGVEPELRRKP